MMKINEVVKMTKEIAEANGVKLSQKDTRVVIDALGETVVNILRSGESCKINDVTYSTVEVPAKSGVTKLGGEAKPWSTEAYTKVTVKAAKGLKELLK
jgi:DNA-binding protein HU-beta